MNIKEIVADCIELGYTIFLLDEDFPGVKQMLEDAGYTFEYVEKAGGYVCFPDDQLLGVDCPVV